MAVTRPAASGATKTAVRRAEATAIYVWEGTDKRGVVMKGEQPAKSANLVRAGKNPQHLVRPCRGCDVIIFRLPPQKAVPHAAPREKRLVPRRGKAAGKFDGGGAGGHARSVTVDRPALKNPRDDLGRSKCRISGPWPFSESVSIAR